MAIETDAFWGTRSTGDFVTDQRKYSWRDVIYREYINGDLPLTALTSKMRAEAVPDPRFYWWSKGFPVQGGSITDIYTDIALATAYDSDNGPKSAGGMLFIKVADDVAQHFRKGFNVALACSTNPYVQVAAEVNECVRNGDSSYLVVTLLEADKVASGHKLETADYVMSLGTAHAEGAEIPKSIAYNPVNYYNLTQIFRTPLEMTRTAMKTKLRTPDQWAEARREALELHGMDMEYAFLFGIMSEGTGENGKPKRTTRGLVPFVQTYAAANCSHYTTSTIAAASGKTWLQGGGAWLNYYLELISRYGSAEKDVFCGNAVITAINDLAEYKGNIQLVPGTNSFGMKVKTWVSPFLTLNFRTHPMFNLHPMLRNACVIFEAKNLEYRYIDDTFYKETNRKLSNGASIDGVKDEYITEAGLEFHLPSHCGFLTGFGTDNTVS